ASRENDYSISRLGSGSLSKEPRFTGSADGRGPRRGSPVGVLRLVRIDREARKNQSLPVFCGLVKTLRLRRDADGTSALPVISGIEPIQLSTSLVRQSLNSYKLAAAR